MKMVVFELFRYLTDQKRFEIYPLFLCERKLTEQVI